MEALATHLAPARVSCLTGVRAGTHEGTFPRRVYRRPALFGKVSWWRAAPFGIALADVIARARPDLALLATADDGYLGLWLRRWLGLPFVIVAHGNEVLRALQRDSWLKARRALHEADGVLAVSRFTERLLIDGGIDPQRISVTYLGCDAERFRPVPVRPDFRRAMLGRRADTPVILTVGNLVERKGHDTIIKALPRIRQEAGEVTYLIVGSGRHRDRLGTLAHEVGVADQVVFGGPVKDRDLAEVYSMGDVFAMPSRARLNEDDVEGLGLVALEASACARPVVGGRAGGMPEVIAHGETGLLTEPNDPGDVGAAIVRLLNNRDEAREMGIRGRLRVLEKFAWRQVGDRARGALAKALAAGRGAGRVASDAVVRADGDATTERS